MEKQKNNKLSTTIYVRDTLAGNVKKDVKMTPVNMYVTEKSDIYEIIKVPIILMLKEHLFNK